MNGDAIEVVIDHDGAFPALRPVRVSYFDPATGEPCDHQVGVQVSRPVRPKAVPGKGQAPFNGYPASAGARPKVKRVCARCGGAFMVPRQGGRVPKTCPECRKEARYEQDLRRQERKARARAVPRGASGVRVEVVAYDRLTGERRGSWPSMSAAAGAGWFSRNYLAKHLPSGPVTSGWTVLARADEPGIAWPRPVVADDGRVRVAFADREAVRDAFGLSLAELARVVDHGGTVPFHGREVAFEEVYPSPALADLRRWMP